MAKYNYSFNARAEQEITTGSGASASQIVLTNQTYGSLLTNIDNASNLGDLDVWLTGFSFSLAAIQPVVTESVEVYFVFQARFSDNEDWITFANGNDSSIQNQNGRSNPYFWLHPGQIYGFKYLFYGDMLKNNNNILYKIIKNSAKLQLRCICYSKAGTLVKCYWGNSRAKMAFHYQTKEATTWNVLTDDYTKRQGNEIYVSPKNESTTFIIHFDGIDPGYIPKYSSYGWQYKKEGDSSWSDITTGGGTLSSSSYKGGSVFRSTSQTTWTSAALDLERPIQVVIRTSSLLVSLNEVPKKKGETYFYQLVFKSDIEGFDVTVSGISITCQYNSIDLNNITTKLLNTKNSDKIILGTSNQTDLVVSVLVEGGAQEASQWFQDNYYYVNSAIIKDANTREEKAKCTHTFTQGTGELLINLSQIESNAFMVITFLEAFPSDGDICSSRDIEIPITILEGSPLTKEEIKCSPGIITDTAGIPTLGFYSTTNLRLEPSEQLTVEKLNPNGGEFQLDITDVSSVEKKITWKTTDSATNSMLIIGKKVWGDYSTFTPSYLELAVQKRGSLTDLAITYKDKNSTIEEKSYPEVETDFRFYDNITFELTSSDSNPINYNFKASNAQESSIINFGDNGEGSSIVNENITDEGNYIHTIDITVGEYELLRTKGTKLILILTDIYGQQIILDKLAAGQLRPVKFDINSFTIDSSNFEAKIQINTNISDSDRFTYRATIVHPLDEDKEGAIYSFIIPNLEDEDEENNESILGSDLLSGYQIKQTKIDYTCGLEESKLINALRSHDGMPPCKIIQYLSFTDFPHCVYTVETNTNYNFTREVRALTTKESITITTTEYNGSNGMTYLNGSQNVDFEISISDSFSESPYKINGFNYEEFYSPPIVFTVKDDYGSSFDTIKLEKQENLDKYKTTTKIPNYTVDGIIKYNIYANGVTSLLNKTFNVAKWSVAEQIVTINELIYDFNNNIYQAKITYDNYYGGSEDYGNSSLESVVIYDENSSTNKTYLTYNSATEYWTNLISTYIDDEESASEFYNLIIEVTFVNTAGDTLTIKSEPYLISKLVDLTIRRGRVGINVPQDFAYDVTKETKETDEEGNEITKITKHFTPTLEIHQRESTQINQPEIIKIVSCLSYEEEQYDDEGILIVDKDGNPILKQNPSPLIGFYSADNHCYGHISATSTNLTVMTPEEVKALFTTTTGGDTNE